MRNTILELCALDQHGYNNETHCRKASLTAEFLFPLVIIPLSSRANQHSLSTASQQTRICRSETDEFAVTCHSVERVVFTETCARGHLLSKYTCCTNPQALLDEATSVNNFSNNNTSYLANHNLCTWRIDDGRAESASSHPSASVYPTEIFLASSFCTRLICVRNPTRWSDILAHDDVTGEALISSDSVIHDSIMLLRPSSALGFQFHDPQ